MEERRVQYIGGWVRAVRRVMESDVIKYGQWEVLQDWSIHDAKVEIKRSATSDRELVVECASPATLRINEDMLKVFEISEATFRSYTSLSQSR